MRYAEHAECEFPADVACIADAVGKVREYGLRYGLAPEHWPQVELALVEGLNNAILHGCAGIRDAVIRLRWSWADDVLEARIFDPGIYQPATAVKDLPDDLLAEKGRGAFMMTAMMDAVEHTLVEGKHCLTLRKRIGKRSPLWEIHAETQSILEGMTADLSASYESLSALFHFSEELATAPSFDHLLQSVARRLRELLDAGEIYVRLRNAEGTLEPAWVGNLGALTLLPVPASEISAIEEQVFAHCAPATVEDCSRLAVADPLWRKRGHAFVCPVFFQNKALGVLAVIRSETSTYFSAGQLSLIRVVADLLGIARTTAGLQERRQTEQRVLRGLEIAAEIQQSLLPKSFPISPKARIFGISQAAQEVGGDYFDAVPIGDKGVLLAIADVMGKGMPAALLATVLRTAIRARIDLAEDPGRLLSEVNRQISSDLAKLDMFVTAQVAFFSHETMQLTVANAGHCPIIKLPRGKERAVRLEAGGIPLGVIDDVFYESTRHDAAPGDRFVLLTDGLYEAEAATGEMLGLDRLTARILETRSSAPDEFCGAVLDYVCLYSGNAQASDDRTILLLECRH